MPETKKNNESFSQCGAQGFARHDRGLLFPGLEKDNFATDELIRATIRKRRTIVEGGDARRKESVIAKLVDCGEHFFQADAGATEKPERPNRDDGHAGKARMDIFQKGGLEVLRIRSVMSGFFLGGAITQRRP